MISWTETDIPGSAAVMANSRVARIQSMTVLAVSHNHCSSRLKVPFLPGLSQIRLKILAGVRFSTAENQKILSVSSSVVDFRLRSLFLVSVTTRTRKNFKPYLWV